MEGEDINRNERNPIKATITKAKIDIRDFRGILKIVLKKIVYLI
jgi:hypothetical protein